MFYISTMLYVIARNEMTKQSVPRTTVTPYHENR